MGCFQDVRVMKLWGSALLVGALSTLFFMVYSTMIEGWSGVETFNRATANAAMILIGISFIISGISYFWDFADYYTIYRKYWGLVGFWLASLHGFVSLAQHEFDLGYFLLPQNIVAFLSALASMLILVMMAVISNVSIIKKLGGKRWRALLRVGYFAYIFAIIHIAIKAWPQWESAFISGNALPPASMLTVAFGLIVLGMRIALQCALWKKSSQKD